MIMVSAAEIKGKMIASCYSVFKFLYTSLLQPHRQHRPTAVTVNSVCVCVYNICIWHSFRLVHIPANKCCVPANLS